MTTITHSRVRVVHKALSPLADILPAGVPVDAEQVQYTDRGGFVSCYVLLIPPALRTDVMAVYQAAGGRLHPSVRLAVRRGEFWLPCCWCQDVRLELPQAWREEVSL